jgi:hypothetical protein
MHSIRCKTLDRGVGPYGSFICPNRASQYVAGVYPDLPNYLLPVCEKHAANWMIEQRTPISEDNEP